MKKIFILIFLVLVTLLAIHMRNNHQRALASTHPELPQEFIVESRQILLENAGRAEISPDGSQILFHRPGTDGRYDVYLMDSNAENIQCLTCSASEFTNLHAGNASWHPNGTHFAFQAEKESYMKHPGSDKLTHPGIGWYNDIWIGSVNSPQFNRITTLLTKQQLWDKTKYAAVLHPHFSEDGSKISWGQTTANTIWGWNNWELIVADFLIEDDQPSVTNQTSYTPQNINQEYYESDDFNREGDQLLISANLEPNQDPLGMDIYSYNFKTQELTRLTHAFNDWDEAAIYSPDFTKIVWLSSTGYAFNAQSKGLWWQQGQADFWIMDADGSNKQQLTFFNTPNSPDANLVGNKHVIPAYIEWHPDGTKLLASIVVRDGKQVTDMIIGLDLTE